MGSGVIVLGLVVMFFQVLVYVVDCSGFVLAIVRENVQLNQFGDWI